jgi:hypothetical protein
MGLRFTLKEAISFKGWSAVLKAADVPPFEKGVFEREIISFLHFCKTRHSPVTIELIRFYLQEIGAQEASASRRALLWFVEHAPSGRVNGFADAVGRVNGFADAVGRVNGFADAVGRNDGAPELRSGGAVAAGVRRSDTPKAARADMGGPEWEKRLIAACRERGFQWRTEETYRMWAVRFADFIKPRGPETADAREVTAFLSMLAVEQRASASSQKQAA